MWIIILIAIVLFSFWRNYKLNKEDEGLYSETSESTESGSVSNLKEAAYDITKVALKKIGCQPEQDGEDSLIVKYQGETFSIRFDGVFARIWDPGWTKVSLKDSNLNKMKEAVNATNYNFGPTIVFSDPDKNGDIVLHAKRDIMLNSNFEDVHEYIQSVFDSFFVMKNNLREEYNKIEEKEREKTKKRRPIGFNASAE